MPEHTEGARPMLSSTASPGLAPFQHVTKSEPAPEPAVVKAEIIPPAAAPAPATTSTAAAIKIAGLGSLVQGVRDQISGLRTELPALGQSIQDLRASVTAVKAQVDAVHDDLKFEATTLGNGSGD